METAEILKDDVGSRTAEVRQEMSNMGLARIREATGSEGSEVGSRRIPLSYHQERLWFIDRFETGQVYDTSPTYHNIPLILYLTNLIDSEALEESLNGVIARHDALRTRIVGESDQGFQEIRPHKTLELSIVDLAQKSGDMSIDGLVELALDDARRPFLLESDLPIRATLFQKSAAEAVLVVTAHHIVVDKVSMRIIAEELAAIYRKRTTSWESDLPSPAMQYSEYATWQRRLPGEVFEPHLFYWKRRIGRRPRPLELPSIRTRPAVHTFNDARHTFVIEQKLADQIAFLGQQEGTSESALFLAAFKVVLRRYARQDEIVVGTSAAGRTQPRTESIVGPVSNLLVLRSQLAGNPSFRSLLKQIDKRLSEALRYQDMPFDRLVLELSPQKDMSRTALFDVLFQFEEGVDPLEMGSCRARVIDTNVGFGKYDLNVAVQKTADGFVVNVVHNADLYDSALIKRMMRHFEAVLGAGVSAPEQQIDSITLLSQPEEAQQLVKWNQTNASYPADRTLDQIFEEQVKESPDKTAISVGEHRLTYRELSERANQIGHYLRNQGVVPDTLVALCLDRTADMIVAMLGILKAGAGYLPIDPAYPEERQRFMIDDSRVTHLITRSGLIGRAADAVESVILLDADQTDIASQPFVNPLPNTSSQNLAYCIYTSGSTGAPKGVLLSHHNVVRLMKNGKFPLSFTSDDVWTMFHSYCFDFSVWEMYGALLYGGTLVVVPEPVTLNPQLFLELVRQESVTVLNHTPNSFSVLAQRALNEGWPKLGLRYVIFGGEALDPTKLRQWNNAYPDVKLINMYGITETTVHVTFKEMSPKDVDSIVSNIGGPIPTTTTYILDSMAELLPAGVPGELHVGGEGVARAYLHRPELTAEKLIPHPFGTAGGERIYRSGDLGRYLEEGEIEYLGRIDHQVKIRGFRIEPGEIEAAIRNHGAVREAVVLAREDTPGARRLVAYIVADERVELQVSELRDSLRKSLPEYMVPSAFVVLDALPLSANGKVDRRALPEPSAARPEVKAPFAAPETDAEQRITEVWQEALGVDRVGVDDNFFDVGGHSMLMLEVQWKLQKSFDREIPLVKMFENPTVRSLARGLTGSHEDKHDHAKNQTRAQARVAAVKHRRRQREPRGGGEGEA